MSEKESRLFNGAESPDGSCRCREKNNSRGYYSRLGDSDKIRLWSSSGISDLPNGAWHISFGDGSIGSIGKDARLRVRCVREIPVVKPDPIKHQKVEPLKKRRR